MRPSKIHVSFEKDKHGVVAYCDELNAVASGKTKAEAKRNLLIAVKALLDEYGDEVKSRLKGRMRRSARTDLMRSTSQKKPGNQSQDSGI